MLKSVVIAAVIAMSGASAHAAPAAFVSATLFQQQERPQITAAWLASQIQEMVGAQYEGGLVIQAIAADGDTLVFTLDGPAGWREGLTAPAISALVIDGFCQSAPEFFSLGITIRVDSLEEGGALMVGPLVDHCPA